MDGLLVTANPMFLELSGLSQSSVSELHFQQLLTRAGAIFYETQFIQSLLSQSYLKEVAFDLVRHSGETVPVLMNASIRKDVEGKPCNIRLAMFDATERRLYERDLLQSRKKAEQVAEVVLRSADAIITLSPRGTIQSWNHGAEQMFAYSPAEALGQTLVDLLFLNDRRNEIGESIALLQKGLDVRKEIVGFHRDGREIELSISLTPHMEPPGILVAFSAIIRDITSRRRAERALIQSEKLASVGRLASSVAHEINNPLEAVTNLLYILGSQASTPDTQALIRTAQEELDRVSQIVTHTLRFYRQSSSRTELDLGTLFVSALALYRARLANCGVAVLIKRSDASALFCYEGEIRQIVLNIVGNAFDAMRSGGRLIVSHRDATLWSSGARGVRITIADTGTGIETSIIRRIFEPFFTTKGIGGTGLGLWITQELVEKNGGTIRIRSRVDPGKSGTVFTLLFPLQAPTST